MKKSLLCLLIFSLLAGVLSGCGTVLPGETTESIPETTFSEPQLSAPDQSVNTLFALPYCYNAAGVFNPILAHSNICFPLFSLLYDGLFATDADGNAVPRLAQEMTAKETTVTIRLRTDALFHDGSPVDSSDVVWSLKMAIENADSAYAGRCSNISSVAAPDRHTVVLTLVSPQGSLANCLDIPIIKNGTGLHSNAVGCGRYRIIEQDESMYLMANEGWYARPEDSVFPIDLIILTYADGLDDLVYSMVSGNSNLVRLDPFIFNDKKISGNCDVYPVMSRNFLYIAFNTSYYAPTGTTSVRKAFAEAIDLEKIVSDHYSGVVYTDGLFPESITGVSPEPAPKANITAATALLREAGYRYLAGKWIDSEGDPLTLTIVSGMDSAKQAVAAAVAHDLTALGAECEIKVTDNLSATVANGNFDIAICQTTLSPDYDFRYLLAYEGAENFNKFVVPNLEEPLADFFRDGHLQNSDTANKINAAVKDSMPIIPIGYKEDSICISREFAFGNIRVAADDPFFNIFDWVRYR